jgi:hypothetical protein
VDALACDGYAVRFCRSARFPSGCVGFVTSILRVSQPDAVSAEAGAPASVDIVHVFSACAVVSAGSGPRWPWHAAAQTSCPAITAGPTSSLELGASCTPGCAAQDASCHPYLGWCSRASVLIPNVVDYQVGYRVACPPAASPSAKFQWIHRRRARGVCLKRRTEAT